MDANAHRIFTIAAGLALVAGTSAAQSFSFASIDVPCSPAPPFDCPNGVARRTAIGGINPSGDIVGVYTDGVGKQHGFLLSGAEFSATDITGTLVLSGGQFTTLDVPGSLVGVPGSLPTVARGIGPSGGVVGSFTAPYNPPASTTAPVDSAQYCPAIGSTACIKGFVYQRGKLSPVLYPGHPGAILSTIEPDGSMYGCLHDYDTMGSMFSAAWIRSGSSFDYTSIAGGGGALSDPSLSFPNSMHGGATPDGRIVVGFWADMMTNHTHGYVLQDGVLHLYDVPNSTATNVWGITPGGELVGSYVDTGGRRHGFAQLPASAIVTIDAPTTAPFNAVSSLVQGISPGGVMVGQYSDTGGHTHGLVVIPGTN